MTALFKRGRSRHPAGPLRICIVAVLVAMALPAPRAPAMAQSQPLSEAQVLRQLDERRDTFVRRAAEEGYPPCAAPTIVLRDTPSFGNYQVESNQIVVASWPSLTDAERDDFAQLAHAIGGHATAVSVFEGGTYRWVFVHELGHWWQHCRRQTRPSSFEEENGANRIALAFWRERDPRFADQIVYGFQALVRAVPSPVPAGGSLQAYVDANFTRVSTGDDYTWVQASSVAALAQETPAPSFHKALSQPLYPW